MKTGIYIQAIGEGHCTCPGGPKCRCGWEQTISGYRWHVWGPTGTLDGETEHRADAWSQAREALSSVS